MSDVALFVLCLTASVGLAWADAADPPAPPAEDAAPVAEPVSPFQATVSALQRGTHALGRSDRGYLDSLLAALRIDPSTQVLVFSKTSLQSRHITPRTPRAVYFGDRAYVGFVPGAPLLEVSVVLDDGRSEYFTLDQGGDAPLLKSEQMCVQCHQSRLTLDVVGPLVRSVYPDEDGFPIQRAKTHLSSDRSPIAERWGGWYVTGKIAGEHMGNRFATDEGDSITLLPPAAPDLPDVAGLIDAERYPSPRSDVVALLILEHQTRLQNRMVHAAEAVREALAYERDLGRMSPDSVATGGVRRRIEREGEDLVRDLLFVGAARLPTPIEGSPGFASAFSRGGKRDPEGRSLRDLSLRRRLFRYPCSYLIQSEAFDQLPSPLLDHVYARLLAILSGADTSAEFEDLTPNMRRAILEILVATKRGLPPGFAAAL